MNVALIGCGGIAPAHIQAYQGIKDVSLEALCDLDINRAKSLASRFKTKKIYSDYREMFEKEDLDLVDICTPVSTHPRIVCDAAKEVPAIFVEKPMALNVSECDKMIAETKKHGTKLCIGHNQIFISSIQEVKVAVDSGKFNLLSLRTTVKESFEILRAHNLLAKWNVLPEQKGIIWESCCHLAYLQLHFFPDIREVYAVGGKIKYPVYDDFAVLLRTRGECFGIIELSWLAHETEIVYEFGDLTGRRLQIYRDSDHILENSEEPPLSVGAVVKNILTDERRILKKWLKFGVCYFRKGKLRPMFNLISSYVESIKNDLPPPVSPEDGRNTINLLECIEKSLDEQRPVSISL
jgi:predicted dehydrogenase